MDLHFDKKSLGNFHFEFAYLLSSRSLATDKGGPFIRVLSPLPGKSCHHRLLILTSLPWISLFQVASSRWLQRLPWKDAYVDFTDFEGKRIKFILDRFFLSQTLLGIVPLSNELLAKIVKVVLSVSPFGVSALLRQV